MATGRPARSGKTGPVIAVIVVGGCLAGLFARPIGFSGLPLVAQAISFKLLLGLGAGAIAVLVAVGAAIRGRLRSATVLTICVALLATGAIFGVTVVARGSGTAAVADPDLTVVEFNTLDTATTPAQLAELVRRSDADIVMLPEADRASTTAAADLLGAAGLDFEVFSMSTPEPYPLPVSAMVRRSLGGYRQAQGPDLLYGSLRLEPIGDSPSAPTIIAVHPVGPSIGSTLSGWRSESKTVTGLCTPGSNVIVAGDFNATVDHPAFAELTCADAADQAGAGGSGTWPSWLPSALAAPIDHVIVDPQRYRGVAAWTVRTGGSDHRALVVQLRRG
ncbi:endonuclease/exonuclease/phosphatase family protein [Nakamurella lactea]|uniref:endonuclease/exonuclease/phosphatase family protein n=1 Tax=Nakamurella lactea TaxID=459515 RepID=UPI0013772809|nr:endonuclease/exonuclease/phosphatase family protein [Nakamurella lactea]